MEGKILIAYFSWSGNTRSIAKLVQRLAGGELFEIEPAAAYPVEYDACVAQAKKEIRGGYRPALKSGLKNIQAYGTVLVGSPNWCSSAAPPVMTFLSEICLSGKTVAPFCTHGGGGQARVLTDMAGLCPDSTVLTGFDVNGDGGAGAKAAVAAWLRKTGVAH